MSAALDPIPRLSWMVVMTADPEFERVLRRLEANGLALYICASDRCRRAKSGPPAVLMESALGMRCLYCGSEMQKVWARGRFVIESDTGGEEPSTT